MTKLQYKAASAIGAAALLLNVTAPIALASVSCTISGNGSDTSNNCDFASLRDVSVDQNNDANIDNNVDVSASTGKNEAEDNTGGDVGIDTGDVSTDVSVDTSANTNVADVQGTSSDNSFDLEVSGNGENSDNSVETNVIDNVAVNQNNDAHVDNNVDVAGYTGANRAKDNTNGDVQINTGDVSMDDNVSVNTQVNANAATVGGNDNGGDLSIKIKDNGSDTDNNVDLALLSDIAVEQNNDAHVDNNVDVFAGTGYNDAKDNTGGDVGIDTGDVNVDVSVDTMANFNTANVDSALSFDNVELKVADNGTESDNNIDLNAIDDLAVDQNNDFDAHDNNVDVHAKTGKNEAEDNTIGGGDPVIETGDASVNVDVNTNGNANAYGTNHDVHVNFDMQELLDLLQSLANLFNL